MSSAWPPLKPYPEWAATCDTVHAHLQVLGKIATAVAPPEPQLQHAALRLTARGWETAPLSSSDGSGTFVITLDMRTHQTVIDHSRGSTQRIALTPNRPVGEVTREVLAAVHLVGGPTEINPSPQEVPWTTPLDVDTEHDRYDADQVAAYFAAATQAALVLTAFRAPYRGRSTPVNAWWGSFDLAVNLFSGQPANPPSDDFLMRNAMDAQEVAVGWWPGDARYPTAAFYAYAHPSPTGFANAALEPSSAQWNASLGEYVLDWDTVRASPQPAATALEFARSAFAHACRICDWDPKLLASMQRTPPPVT